MYAIVKTGGKQYRVERGQRLLVERLSAEEGASVALQPVLYRSDETIFDADGLGRVQVQAKILEHVRGEKLRVFKFKPKRGYRRRTGHRQELTQIEVTEIKLAARRARAQVPAKEKPEEGSSPAAESPKPPATARRRAPAKPAKPASAKPTTAKEASDGS
jgi:large subunit ribosomal protein L21